MGQLTTHVLDIAAGIPASGMAGRLLDKAGAVLVSFTTNGQGRLDGPLLHGSSCRTGSYALVFMTAAYFRAQGLVLPDPPFLDEIRLSIGIADAQQHYHVPLLVSPWSFSTYRGS